MSTTTPTIVLIHGGFVDGSGWQAVHDLLRQDGYDVAVVQNPTLSLEGDVAATHHVVDEYDGPVVLVGHSYGGVVVTEAGNHPQAGGHRTGELAKHTSDIRYVFGNLDPADDYDQTDQAVSDAMQSAWTEFARTGVPASGSAWPRFDPSAPKLTFIGDTVQTRPMATTKLTEIIASSAVMAS